MAKPRKILIGTPIRLGLTSTYISGFIDVMRAQIPNLTIEFCIIEGPSVNLARNEIAHYAKAIKADDLLFIDSDLKWTTEHFKRILQYEDLDIVGGIYCKKVGGDPQWLMNAIPGGIDPDAEVCEVAEIATGFMKIRVEKVFGAIEKTFPELKFHCYKEFKNIDGSGFAHEYFPMGVTGTRHPRNRLTRIKEELENLRKSDDPGTEASRIQRMSDAIAKIDQACYDDQPPGLLRGEDYYFCYLAREAGCKVYADFGMAVLPHVGNAAYPITPDLVGVKDLLELPDTPKPAWADGLIKPHNS